MSVLRINNRKISHDTTVTHQWKPNGSSWRSKFLRFLTLLGQSRTIRRAPSKNDSRHRSLRWTILSACQCQPGARMFDLKLTDHFPLHSGRFGLCKPTVQQIRTPAVIRDPVGCTYSKYTATVSSYFSRFRCRESTCDSIFHAMKGTIEMNISNTSWFC